MEEKHPLLSTLQPSYQSEKINTIIQIVKVFFLPVLNENEPVVYKIKSKN